MTTEIRYTDIFGTPITFQQHSSLLNFKKLTFVSNEIKMVEVFECVGETNYKTVNYYINASEDRQAIIQQYVRVMNNSLVIYSNKQSIGNFNLWDWESYYSNSQIVGKGKEVIDSKLRTIFICDLDLSTNVLISGARKYYYANQFDGSFDDRLLEFSYDQNGDVDLIFDSNENFGYIEGISLSAFLGDIEFSEVGFPWSQHPYYHSALLYLPTGDL